ncbi:MAG TPA: hemin uptake protein HemP [Herminiimonas sp.]|jgi:hemin uptake protein HemP|nr:hemin uptake protein HemP [Herminiimonas sp.]
MAIRTQDKTKAAAVSDQRLVAGAEQPVERINSSDLFREMREVEIAHGGRIYRLRLTQLNKLILTA